MADEVLQTFPDLTEEMENEAKSLFKHYIFYESHADDSRDCRCSWCGEEWSYAGKDSCYGEFEPVANVPPDHLSIAIGKHNDMTYCPFCESLVTLKNRKRIKTGACLVETKQVIFIIPDCYDQVYMRAFFIFRSGDAASYRFSESTRYYVELGAAYAWRKDYDYTGLGIATSEWKLRRTFVNPFQRNGLYTYLESWYYIGVETLDRADEIEGMTVAEVKDLVAKSKQQGEQLSLFENDLKTKSADINDLKKSVTELERELDDKKAKINELESKPVTIVEDIGERRITEIRQNIVAEYDSKIAELEKKAKLSDNDTVIFKMYLEILKTDYEKAQAYISGLTEEKQLRYKKALFNLLDALMEGMGMEI